MQPAKLGIIGGSGLYDLPDLVEMREQRFAQPWGDPSDALRFAKVAAPDGGTREIVFLPRHGRGHRLSPSGINYRANIDALKRAGVTDLVCFSAVGSYRENLPPGTFVVVDQIVDRTFRRETSFFGEGCVAHVPFSHPVGPRLAARVAAALAAEGVPHKVGGTAICIEGPQFSTLAESRAYRALEFDVIGMTSMPEAKLAREAELTYCMVAMVTDFDAWHPDHGEVDVAMVVKQMHANTEAAQRAIMRLAADFPLEREPCPAGSHRALDGAIMTAPGSRSRTLVAKLDAVAGRVLLPSKGAAE
jgi:5'-methylthioadenosine phosphorylase